MNWNVSLKELEAEATRAAIHIAMLEAIGAIVFFVVLYFVIKAAVRDGINEANRTSGRPWLVAVERNFLTLSQDTAHASEAGMRKGPMPTGRQEGRRIHARARL